MSSRSLDRCVRIMSVVALLSAAGGAIGEELRVCADPDNLPYSHRDGSGFENRIAELVARDLGARRAYAWHPMQRDFVRKTLGARVCDVLIGVPERFERALTTRAHYRSSFVFVQRTDDGPLVRSFADPRLAGLRIGLQLVGNDMAATPPGHALARNGITENVSGYLPLGDGPAAARIVNDLARERLDLGLVWGPQAGYFASDIYAAFGFFVAGGLIAVLMRLQLARPDNVLVGPDLYNQLFSMHGTTMMFLFAVPVMQAMAVYLVPLMVGARTVAFPRLNAFAYWMYLFGGLDALCRVFSEHRARCRMVQLCPARGAVILGGKARGRVGAADHVHRVIGTADGDRRHRDDPEAARAGHDAQSRAAVLLGHAGHHDHDPGRHARCDGREHRSAARSPGRDALLQPGGRR